MFVQAPQTCATMTDQAPGAPQKQTSPAETVPLAWTKTELARHPQRPDPMSFIESIFTDLSEIHGDRAFGDDPAMYCGFARFDGEEVMVIGNIKGRTTKEKVYRKFGMPDPEGYRKALRAMKLAEKFGRPIFTFIDLMGANPGLGAEERGQAEAIARNLREMARLPVPVIAVCIGEGGSGGALALGVGSVVLMLENAVYSVISPENCANIIFKDAGKAQQVAPFMRLTAEDLLELKLIDGIVPEPAGGAHEDAEAAAEYLRIAVRERLEQLQALTGPQLVEQRYDKFRKMGNFFQ